MTSEWLHLRGREWKYSEGEMVKARLSESHPEPLLTPFLFLLFVSSDSCSSLSTDLAWRACSLLGY